MAGKKCLKCEIFHELASMSHACVNKKAERISFCNDKYHATVAFHENCIVELTVTDKGTDEIPFYLHFQMREPESSRNNIKAFFDFFMKKDEEKDELDVAALAKSRPIKLLISCTSGMTSSYFAYTLQNSLSSEGLVMAIDAVSYTQIDKVWEEYDYILLAPQIAYKLPEYQSKYGKKVMTIDAMDFARGNVNGVVNRLVRMDRGIA